MNNDELTYRVDGQLMPASQAIEYITKRAQEIADPISRQAFLDFYSNYFNHEITIKETKVKNQIMERRIIGFIGLAGLIGMILLVYFTPYVSKWQSGFLWVGMCVFTGACIAVIPGVFNIKFSWLTASGGVAFIWWMYTHPPTVFNQDFTKPADRLKMYAIINDTSSITVIPVEFNSLSKENFCTFSKKAVVQYYGASPSMDSLTFFRKVDGKMYSDEKCLDINEREIIIVSNKVIRLFANNREAYTYMSAAIDRNSKSNP